MKINIPRRSIWTAALLAAGCLTPALLHGQAIKDELPFEIDIKRGSGQTIQPVYEGWEENPDGHISIWFGYFNRNFEEQIDIPVGEANTVDFVPSGDAGQPTHFYSRRQKFLFKIDVPANFDKKKKVVWSVIAGGQKLSAVGWLQPEWEIDNGTRMENNGGSPDPDNHPPQITGDGPQTVAVGKTLVLNASASDDGLPRPAPELAKPVTSNLPDTAPRAKRARGVSISWIIIRNPGTGGTATFDPPSTGIPVYGKPVQSTTKVIFTKPGTYLLRAIATDTTLEAAHDIKVTVTAK